MDLTRNKSSTSANIDLGILAVATFMPLRDKKRDAGYIEERDAMKQNAKL